MSSSPPPGEHLADNLFPADEPTGGDVSMQDADESQPAPAEANENEDTEMGEGDDLFGDLGGEDEDEDRQPQALREGTTSDAEGDGEPLTPGEAEARRRLEYGEDDLPTETYEHVTQVETTLNVPNIPPVRSSDGKHWLVRVPNFLAIEPQPFDPQTWQVEDPKDVPAGGPQNTVRWRWKADGEGRQVQQSNARIVKWSDGSMSLQLGTEFFDITANLDSAPSSSVRTKPRSTTTSGAGPSTSEPIDVESSTGTATPEPTVTQPTSNPLTYLYAQHNRAQLFASSASFSGSLSFRPPSLHSATHRRLASTVNSRHVKAARMLMVDSETAAKDPERELARKLEEEKKRGKSRRRATGGGGGGGGGRGAARRRARFEGADYTSEEEDGAGPVRGGARGAGGGEYEADDGFVVEDESDSDASFTATRKKSTPKSAPILRRKRSASLDSLEALDRKIEASQKSKRSSSSSKKRGSGSDEEEEAEESGEEDVESEDLDEEGPVGNTGKAGRRKKVLSEEEDE